MAAMTAPPRPAARRLDPWLVAGLALAVVMWVLVIAWSNPAVNAPDVWNGQPVTAQDARSYYNFDYSALYAGRTDWNAIGAYPYSPAFAQALYPLNLLPWPLFVAVWTAVLIAAVWALTGPEFFLLGLVVAFVACSPVRPAEVRSGDVCWRCKRSIQNVSLAAELVARNGLAYKFRTVHCLAAYLVEQPGEATGTLFVTDATTGRMIHATSATYVVTVIDEMTNERDFLAFGSRDAAAAVAAKDGLQTYDWAAVLDTGQQDRVAD